MFGLVCWSVFVSSVARLLAFASMCSWAAWVTSWWFWVVVYIRAVPEGMVEIADAILDNPETKKKPKPLQDWQQRSRQDLVLAGSRARPGRNSLFGDAADRNFGRAL